MREILRRQQNVEVLLGWATDVDVAQRIVTANAPTGIEYQVPYDTLIVAAGASQSYFGNDQFAENAPGMKSIDDALELRGRIFGAFEMAELETDQEAIDRWLTFVVVGADRPVWRWRARSPSSPTAPFRGSTGGSIRSARG